MPDPYKEPADFVDWMGMALYEMFAENDSLITKKAGHLLQTNLVSGEHTKFGLRPGMKFMNLTRSKNIEALIITLCGTEAETSCEACSRGRGLFARCMVVTNMAQGSCSNCCYNGQSFRCNLHGTCEYISIGAG